MQPPNEHPGDSGRRALAAGVLAAVSAVAQLVMGKAVRDGFFLANFDAEVLPRMMVVASAASLASVVAVSRAMAWLSPRRVAPALFGVAALLLIGQGVLAEVAPRVAAVLVHPHMAVFGATAVSSFWSLIENVLPDDIRRRLWPYVNDRRPRAEASKRSRREVLEELLASGAEMNVESLRRSLRERE